MKEEQDVTILETGAFVAIRPLSEGKAILCFASERHAQMYSDFLVSEDKNTDCSYRPRTVSRKEVLELAKSKNLQRAVIVNRVEFDPDMTAQGASIPLKMEYRVIWLPEQ